MLPNNLLSSLTCKLSDQKLDVQDILQRITPIQFVTDLDTLTVQSTLEAFNLFSGNGYIHHLRVDSIDIGGITYPFYTGATGPIGATGPTGILGMIGTATNPGATGPTGANISQVPFDFYPPLLSITDPAPTVIRTDVAFEAGTPENGFYKTVINGYTGAGLLSPIASSIGSMLNNNINVLQKAGNTVYIGGNFTSSVDGTVAYPYIAKWDEVNGLQQVDGPTGPNGNVYSMAYDFSNNLLYVGGLYTGWGGVPTSPSYIGAWNVASQAFQTLGTNGNPPSGSSFSCCSMAMDEATGKLYTGWEIGNVNNQLRVYQDNLWSGITGTVAYTIPKKLIPDSANNILYAGYDSWIGNAEPVSMFQKIYSINETTGARANVYSGTANTTMTMDDTNRLYIGVKAASATASLPFGTKSYMGTYSYGDISISPFHEVANPINNLNFDKTNNLLYICANTINDTFSTIIDQKTYQSIISYDGSGFKSVADADVYYDGLLEPASNNNIIISPYNYNASATYSTWPYLRQPSRASDIDQVYIYNCGRINQDASLSITAPIHYYSGGTGSSYTLYNIGDQVDMTWDTATNSWWV